MSQIERPAENHGSQEEHQEGAVSRRQLLKALIATGGAVTASTLLPGEWSKPIVEVGVLPAHAQVTPLPGETPTPTATAEPIAAIIGCYAFNAAGGGNIRPTDTIRTYADISPALSGIELRRTITLNEGGHPQNGVVAIHTGPTDASGRCQLADFDLSTLSPTISPGIGRLTILWGFVDPADGTNTCENIIDIIT
jgi:hypothetical protein